MEIYYRAYHRESEGIYESTDIVDLIEAVSYNDHAVNEYDWVMAGTANTPMEMCKPLSAESLKLLYRLHGEMRYTRELKSMVEGGESYEG